MVEQLLSNPALACGVVAVALFIGAVLKVSKKVLKIILLVGIAYVLVTSSGVF